MKHIIKEPARAREDFSRWLFKGIDNGDIKELFFKFFSTPFFQKIIFGFGFGWQKSFFCKWICGNILWIFLLSFFKKAGA